MRGYFDLKVNRRCEAKSGAEMVCRLQFKWWESVRGGRSLLGVGGP